MAHYDVPRILRELEEGRGSAGSRRDELSDAEVRELLELGVLSDERVPGTSTHALSVLLGASATALLIHAAMCLPKEKP